MSVEFMTVAMFVTLILAITLGHELAFTLAAVATLFGLIDNGFNVPALFLMFANNAWGLFNNYTLVAIPLFIFMAQLLDQSKVAEALFEAAFRATPHQQHAGSRLADGFHAVFGEDAHHALAHADRSNRHMLVSASSEDDDSLPDCERGLAFDPHGQVSQLASQRFDDDLVFAWGVPAEVLLDPNPVPGPQAAVLALK